MKIFLPCSGCLTQLLGGIDTDWASFSEAIERLMTFVRNKDGIESVIKNLDGKLSEAIMHAMTNGPDLQKKVSNSSSFFSFFATMMFMVILDFIDSRFIV
jgi:dally-like protein